MVLEFLTELYNLSLGYSAINTARSVVSAVLHVENRKAMGFHPLVVRFIKGFFEKRTPVAKYENFWDVSGLLDYLKMQKPNCDLSLKDLTLKLCALLLVATAQRVQTIHLLKLDWIEFVHSGCKIHVLDKVKQTRPGHVQNVLELCFMKTSSCVL